MARSTVIIWEVWCTPDEAKKFFVTKREAESHIRTQYNAKLHPDDHWHGLVRENYGGLKHHYDGEYTWIAWTSNRTIHLIRHEIETSATGIALALNALAKRL